LKDRNMREVPEGELVDMVQTVYQKVPASDPRSIEHQRRLVATTWLKTLCETVHDWNLEFVELLRQYPGRTDSKDPKEYSRFFAALVKYKSDLLHRTGGVKERLCRPLIQLNRRLPVDFEWLQSTEPQTYYRLQNTANEAYNNEVGVIRIASNVIDDVISWDAPFSEELRSGLCAHAKPEFIEWQILNRGRAAEIINEYQETSFQKVEEIRKCSEQADVDLLPIEKFAEREAAMGNISNFLEKEIRVTQKSNQSAVVNVRLYTILAFAFGVVFFAALLVLTTIYPNPSATQ
jgi:hypothetical protein